ncbi:MAG TPA: RNA polymerase sigma factor [Candidatus Saccharimonadales bacterium]|nr:RNA polymerase sigma factor [Candidatus Saccharimonadales bacterium]
MIDENKCISAIIKGDANQYRILVERYQTGLIIHCENLLKDREDGEDVAQEAFIKAYNNLAAFSKDKARFSTWLYRIATNLCIDHLRKNKRKVHIENVEEYVDTIQLRALEQNDVVAIRQAVETLEPPLYSQIIKAYFWEGKSYKEIAELHNTSINTVGTWISRAKAQLKEKLV